MVEEAARPAFRLHGGEAKDLTIRITLANGYHIAEAVDVPGFLARPVPMFSPTRAFPNPVLQVADLGRFLNRMSYGALLSLMTGLFHRTINRWRKKTLGLPPQRLLASELYLGSRPVQKLICCSPHVAPTPADWDDSTTISGYWFLNNSREWQPPAHLEALLETNVWIREGVLKEDAA